MRRRHIATVMALAIGLAASPVLADETIAQVEPAPVSEAAAAAEAPAPTGVVTAAPAAAPADDVDLAALGLETGQEQKDEALRIYGFADFTFTVPTMKDDGFVAAVTNGHTTAFAMGSFNLYLAKNISPKWRTLGEVRLLYAPNGNLTADGDYSNSVAADNTNLGRNVTWGGISIERLYLEYDVVSWATVRIGHFLSPYGIWNVDHGSPVIIGTMRPYIIGEQLIPEHQTGIDIYGKKYFGDIGVGYHLTVSNGRGPLEAINDLDGNKAVGGRLELTTRWLGAMTFGISGYAGTYTDKKQDIYIPMASGDGVTLIENIDSRYDERAMGADVQYDRGGFHFQAEYLYRQLAYDEAGRAKQQLGYVPDSDSKGFYLFAGYRLPWMGLMPFAQFEHYVFPTAMANIIPRVDAISVGLNLRPTPSTVLKAQFVYAALDSLLDKSDYYSAFITQAAWAF